MKVLKFIKDIILVMGICVFSGAALVSMMLFFHYVERVCGLDLFN